MREDVTMTNWILVRAVALTLGIAMLFSVGCAGRSRPARFYVLSPIASSVAETTNISGFSQKIVIGISPVTLPKYLRKSQIVTRTGSNELHLAEYDRWAGKIEEDIGRVITENLGHILGTDKVVSSASMVPIDLDYTIKIDIIRFDGRLGGDLELFAQWTIFDNQDKALNGIETSHIIEPTAGSSFTDMVAAQSRALYGFSRELADVIKKLTGS